MGRAMCVGPSDSSHHAGKLYLTRGYQIYRINLHSGRVDLLAGSGQTTYNLRYSKPADSDITNEDGTGPAVAVQPDGMVCDPNHDRLWIADNGYGSIRCIDLYEELIDTNRGLGVVKTVIHPPPPGIKSSPTAPDGSDWLRNRPSHMALDPTTTNDPNPVLFIASGMNHTLYRFDTRTHHLKELRVPDLDEFRETHDADLDTAGMTVTGSGTIFITLTGTITDFGVTRTERRALKGQPRVTGLIPIHKFTGVIAIDPHRTISKQKITPGDKGGCCGGGSSGSGGSKWKWRL